MHSSYEITPSGDYEIGYDELIIPISMSVYSRGDDTTNEAKLPLKYEPGEGVQCDICRHLLPTAQKLVIHRRVHAMEINYTCLMCYGTYEDKLQLYTHIQNMHECADTVDEQLLGTTVEPPIIKDEPGVGVQCDICRQLLPTADKLVTHRRVHAMELNYRCLLCYGTYEDKLQLYTHIHQTHACSVILDDYIKCYEGELTNIKDEPGIGVGVQCDICLQLLPSEQKLIAHRLIHAVELNYTCLICHGIYDDRTQLNTHFEEMHACSNPSLKKSCESNRVNSKKCYICNKIFGSVDGVTRHIRNVHCNKGKILNKEDSNSLEKLNIEETYNCIYCHKLFNRRVSLKSHLFMNTCRGKNSKNHEILTRKDSLKRHMHLHINQKPIAAVVHNYEREIDDKDALLYNNSNKISNKQDSDSLTKLGVEKPFKCIFCYKCYICHKVFSSKDSLTRHMRCGKNKKKHCYVRIKKKPRQYQNRKCKHKHLKCDLCKHSLLEHNMPTSNEQQLLECNICHKLCSTQCFHVANTNDDETNKSITTLNGYKFCSISMKYECVICFKQYKQKNSLVQHIRNHSGNRPYLCDKCPKQFNNTTTLKSHLIIHTDIRFECDICHKLFRWKKSLLKHIHKHKPLIEKRNQSLHVCAFTEIERFECLICKKLFHKKYSLKEHIITHTGQRPFKCDVCSKGFAKRKTLTGHKRVHMEKEIECLICQKLLRTKLNLITHMRIHTGEKPYECDVCHKRFAKSTILINHRNVHTGKKSYGCDICHRLFRWMPNLELHKRVHTGEEPYQCNFCSKRFKTSSNLSCHMRSQHIF